MSDAAREKGSGAGSADASGVECDPECGELLQLALRDFREGTGSSALQRLVDELESICRSLVGPSERDRIRTHWWALEQIYASDVLRGGCTDLPAESERRVTEAIGELESLAGELQGQGRAAAEVA